ncbi:ABC transporter ATP-binding protein [Clostridium mobile]|nr:ABC transporter ATP-binding protein [Clostridium mobile]
MESIIELNNVRKVYRMGEEKIIALDDINLKVYAGEVLCLLGTSGSGKSTLLNMMAGLEKPTKGEIIIKNNHIEKMSEDHLAMFRQKYIGFVFQSYNLLPTFSALENVTLPLIFRNASKAQRENRAKKMLEAVGLEKRLYHKPSQMSGGQQQRVSIARAFVNNPNIVFADEPTGNLDTRTTLEIMDLIKGMAKEHNQTLIIVTHDVEISSYADRIVYIRDGNIEKIVNNKNIEVKGEA